MSEFKKGDKVRILKSLSMVDNHFEAGAVGVVRDVDRGIDNTFPFFVVIEGAKHILCFAPNELELVEEKEFPKLRSRMSGPDVWADDEDEYEYAMATRDSPDAPWRAVGDLLDRYDRIPVWGDREISTRRVVFYSREFKHSEFILVKRRKAGEIQVVEGE
jgi:hypothetical protein